MARKPLRLRLATRAEQMHNRRANRTKGTTTYKGVTRDRRLSAKPWRVAIVVNGARVDVGYFADADEAARAYDTAARQHHGAFARLNFPEPGEQGAQRRQSKKQYLNERYQRRRAAGLCYLCEATAETGRTKCAAHLAADRDGKRTAARGGRRTSMPVRPSDRMTTPAHGPSVNRKADRLLSVEARNE